LFKIIKVNLQRLLFKKEIYDSKKIDYKFGLN